MPDEPTTFHLRDARPEDQDAIRSLTLLAYQEYAEVMTPSAWQGLKSAVTNALAVSGSAEQTVVEKDGVIVGSVMLFPAATSSYQGLATQAALPELRMLAVDPSLRGQGIGKALVEECIRRARDSGAGGLGLHSSKSMGTAIALYERMGFERYPADDFQPEGAELIMAFRLRF